MKTLQELAAEFRKLSPEEKEEFLAFAYAVIERNKAKESATASSAPEEDVALLERREE